MSILIQTAISTDCSMSRPFQTIANGMVSVTIPTHHQVDNGIVSLTNPNHHQWHHLFAISNHHQRQRLCYTQFQPIINGIVFFDDNAKLTA